ncbi:MAG: response regulator [Phycisphaerae bacterium]|nr:response regulator [Phycisphaerae bacterium]
MNCNVLIVDDSPTLRCAIAKVAELAGVARHCVFQATNGQEALDALESQPIDLVLLDLNMPVMNGEEFAREVRRRPQLAQSRIVVVSTEMNEARLARMRELGVTETLTKPFEPEELFSLICRLLGANACAR